MDAFSGKKILNTIMIEKSLLILILCILTIANVSAFSIDISICNDPAEIDTYNACIAQFQPILDEADAIQSELDAHYAKINTKTSDYAVCWNQVCAIGTSDPQVSSKKIETEEDRLSCIAALCEPIRKANIEKTQELTAKHDQKVTDYYSEICTNCISPYCSYKHSSDCNMMGPRCEEETGPIYFMGCGNSDIPNTPSGQTPNNHQSTPITKNQVPSTNNQNPTLNSKDKTQTITASLTPTQKQLTKLSKNPGVKVYPIKSKNEVKNLILTNPDNSKANFVDKTDYYKDEMLKKKAGDIIGDIPVLGPYKDYIIKYFDDQKSDAQKTADTQVKLGIGKNAATQFNKMDGTGDTELKLSTGKNLITSTPVTKPFEFVLTQLGNGVKKTMAHGFKSEYESTLEQARVLRKAGLTWSDTIKQTTNLVGEETDGKRWVQTLNAFSKKDYQNQDARIKAYIMQMKMNGELK